jgi:hypothetical protein
MVSFFKSKKQRFVSYSATSAWAWTRSTSFSSFQRSNWSPTYILHLFHLEDTAILFLFLSESVKVRYCLPQPYFFHTQNYCRKWFVWAIIKQLCCKRYDLCSFFSTKKNQNYRYQNYCPWWQEFNFIRLYSYDLLCEPFVKVRFLPHVDTFSFAQEPHVYCF